MIKIFGLFFVWYFKDAVLSILRIWRNFILFVSNYFSIILLLKTLFSPWKRISESYGRGFDFGKFISAFTLNFFSRIIGLCIRTVVIFCGIFAEFFVLIIGAVFFVFWFILPLILVWVLFRGFTMI